MKILKADHLGMCFGVRDAIHLATHQARQQPTTVLGELVHNETVLEDLRREGVQFANAPGQIATRSVMITAHGAAEKTISGLRQRGFDVIEATCPLVHLAHRALGELVRSGYHPVVIGRRDHVEVRGLTGDLEEFDVVLNDRDVDGLAERRAFGVVAQTTQPVAEARRLAARIQERFPRAEVRFEDTVCQPTKQRQEAAVQLARQCDVVIVIGGAHSNNTRQLVATCARYGSRVFHVQSARDLKVEWFAGSEVAGITAGTSTPAQLIEEVEQWMAERFPGSDSPAEVAPAAVAGALS